MRRINRIGSFNAYLEKLKPSYDLKNVNKFEIEALIKVSNLEFIVSFKSISEGGEPILISEDLYFNIFDDTETRGKYSNIYNLLNFSRYIDYGSKIRFGIEDKLSTSIKEIPEIFSFSDVTSIVKARLLNN